MQGDEAIFSAIVLLLFIAIIHSIHWHNSDFGSQTVLICL